MAEFERYKLFTQREKFSILRAGGKLNSEQVEELIATSRSQD